MKFNDLLQALIDNIDAGITTHLKSSPGRGKSEFVEELVKYLSKRDGFEWGYCVAMLATYTPSDLLGYMVPTKIDNPDGTKALASTFTIPPWMMTKPTAEYPYGRHINTYKRGIVFLDEFGQADADTKKSSAPLLLSKKVGPHQLHDGIAVIAASNGKLDRSGVTKDFDFVINRTDEILITDDLQSWLDWAATHGVTPTTCAFVKQNPQIVFADGVPKEQGPWTTPRSTVLADRIMAVKAARNNGIMMDDPTTVEQIHGIMGGGAAQYFQFIKLEREMPKYEDIVADPKGVKVPTKPDAMMLVCYQLAHMIKPEHAAEVITYIDRLPQEFNVTFATTACRRQPRLVATAAFSKWVATNSSLMAAVTLVTSRKGM